MVVAILLSHMDELRECMKQLTKSGVHNISSVARATTPKACCGAMTMVQ